MKPAAPIGDAGAKFEKLGKIPLEKITFLILLKGFFANFINIGKIWHLYGRLIYMAKNMAKSKKYGICHIYMVIWQP
jgi:hypothetical protein